ncbi:MAG: prepilin-type N-terminal cleavage/methylation domain-containing protein [Lachnospiraceae bacterium]|nr:prepilin-type N-terminal cleavage/methylation domain-containing protein [Lachnospiraceae bacterium]
MCMKLKDDNRGMTMTEVLMAFVILAIIMGLLSGIIAFSKRMYMQAADQRRAQEVLQRIIYTKEFYDVKKNASARGIDETVTEYLPVYRVEPVKDEGGNDTGIYNIALIRQSFSGGRAVYSPSSTDALDNVFPNKATMTGSPGFNNSDSVTMGKSFVQINISDWVTDDEKAQLGDLSTTNFIVFNKITN